FDAVLGQVEVFLDALLVVGVETAGHVSPCAACCHWFSEPGLRASVYTRCGLFAHPAACRCGPPDIIALLACRFTAIGGPHAVSQSAHHHPDHPQPAAVWG